MFNIDHEVLWEGGPAQNIEKGKEYMEKGTENK